MLSSLPSNNFKGNLSGLDLIKNFRFAKSNLYSPVVIPSETKILALQIYINLKLHLSCITAL